MRPNRRTCALIALLDAWNCCGCFFLASLNSLLRIRSCRSMISSVTVAIPSMVSATRVARRLELRQVGGRHLAPLAGDLEQAVLVYKPLDARRQVERLPAFEASNVFE